IAGPADPERGQNLKKENREPYLREFAASSKNTKEVLNTRFLDGTQNQKYQAACIAERIPVLCVLGTTARV
ncbi:MAG: hypothetical protein WBN56_15365, partial [Robiginitalea sp.]|uniref:hypothetical protein n=1 Tax=Robiginitalea sp. TaxID=1902411 RepID=UPI003C73402E